jgi:hypothetical protein
MNELKVLRGVLGVGEESARLGTVAEIMGSNLLVVRLDVGAYRRVVGQASRGERVLVQGGRLHSRAPASAMQTALIA